MRASTSPSAQPANTESSTKVPARTEDQWLVRFENDGGTQPCLSWEVGYSASVQASRRPLVLESRPTEYSLQGKPGELDPVMSVLLCFDGKYHDLGNS